MPFPVVDFLPPERQAEIRAIVDAQQKTFRQALATNKNKTFVIQLVRKLHKQIDVLSTQVQSRPNVKFDCQAGCTYCCNFRIDVFAQEVFIIARRLKQLPSESLNPLIDKLREHASRANNLHAKNYLMVCPMLENNRCSVYEDRPSLCRKYHSLDVEECKLLGVGATEDGEMVMKSLALIEGAKQAYAKAKLPLQSHELGQSLYIALTDPSCEDRWYKGEQVFPIVPEVVQA